ncbi:MAG TPA: hypothetical protein PLR54_08240 [Spirochaetota bacterium]|nr:hypothetical protein [Spirochaetota bacterium]HOT19845.1 hypothetical protein [Spirochaetota bacterium]HQG43144.1 hypothetical protein [Spirochaetota bacterium]HQK07641.1 hypothetical protein [Spirochaetota bacterium]HRR60123.1 hypothetical protein [Spirochaetota bacterium]
MKTYTNKLPLKLMCGVCLLFSTLMLYGPAIAQDQNPQTVKQPVAEDTVVQNKTNQQELSPQQNVVEDTTTAEQAPAHEVDTTEKKVVIKEEPKKEAAKPQTKAREVIDQKIQGNDTVTVGTNSLLSITDGTFRYSRIPGITIKENNEPILTVVKEEVPETVEEKGIFGLSKKASDRIAKIILVVIVIFVFILYRMRTKNTRGSVLRRFPK